LPNRKIAHFQGQIAPALKKFGKELDLRMKDLFAKGRLKSHLTAAAIRKCEGYSPLPLLFVLTKVVFLPMDTVPDLLSQPLQSFSPAHQDTFYRFKKAEWSWGGFYRRFIRFLGQRPGCRSVAAIA